MLLALLVLKIGPNIELICNKENALCYNRTRTTFLRGGRYVTLISQRDSFPWY